MGSPAAVEGGGKAIGGGRGESGERSEVQAHNFKVNSFKASLRNFRSLENLFTREIAALEAR